MSVASFDVPSELEFLESFGVEPDVSSCPPDGFWSYRFESDPDVSLVLSFDQHAGSIQTALFLGDRELSTVSHEGSEGLKIVKVDGKSRLVGTCRSKEQVTKLTVEMDSRICVRWASLRTE